MNNKLPEYFSFMKPILPVITERYEIRNPSFHAPAIKHKFAECSLQHCLINQPNSENCFALLNLPGPGYLMAAMVRGGGGGGGGTCAPPPLISKSTNSIRMTIYSTLCKNCSRYKSVICFMIGLGLAEIIRCFSTKVVFCKYFVDCAVAWTISIKFVTYMSSENCCA